MRTKIPAGRSNTNTNQVPTKELAEVLEEDIPVLKRAQEIQANLGIEFPTFLKPLNWTIRQGGNYRGCHIPERFSRLHLLGDDKIVTLITESECESEYKVTYSQDSSKLREGWKRFSTENDLGIGHILIFQLIGHFKFKVYIVRTAEDKMSGDEHKLGSGGNEHKFGSGTHMRVYVRNGADKGNAPWQNMHSAKRPFKDLNMFSEEGASSPRSPPEDFVMFTKEGSDKRSNPLQKTCSAKRPSKYFPQRIPGENIKQKSVHSCVSKDSDMLTKKAKRPCKSPPQHIPGENIKRTSVHSSVFKDSDIFTKKVFSPPRSPPEDLVMFSKGADKNAPSLNTSIAKGPKSLPQHIPGENTKDESVYSRVSKDFDMLTKEGNLSSRSPPKDFVMLTKEGADKRNDPSQNTDSAKGCCKPLPQHVTGKNIEQKSIYSCVSKDILMFTKEGADKRAAPSLNTGSAKMPCKSVPRHIPGENIKQKSVPQHIPEENIEQKSAPQHIPRENIKKKSVPQHIPGENIKQNVGESSKSQIMYGAKPPILEASLAEEDNSSSPRPPSMLQIMFASKTPILEASLAEEGNSSSSRSPPMLQIVDASKSLPEPEASVPPEAFCKDFLVYIDEGVLSSRHPPEFKELHSIDDFYIVVNGLHIDGFVSESVRTKYYELCCSQKSYLHEKILEHVNNSELATSIISKIVEISDDTRVLTYSTPTTEYASWKQLLYGFEVLGMNVGFISNRLSRIERLSGSNTMEDELLRIQVAEARRELLDTEENVTTLEMELSKLKQKKEELAAEIEAGNKTLQERECAFQEEVDAPW